MTDRPIIFSAPMVRALLDGRKTQTRRVLKPLPKRTIFFDPKTATRDQFKDPAYAPGDRLWVREAHAFWADEESARAAQWLEGSDDTCIYRADYKSGSTCENMGGERWRPSIHMPLWASRLTLSVTDVRVQRLQEISAADSISEGVECDTCKAMSASACYGRGCFASVAAFKALWNSIHGPEAWDANPWVVAVSFAVHRCNIDRMEARNDH